MARSGSLVGPGWRNFQNTRMLAMTSPKRRHSVERSPSLQGGSPQPDGNPSKRSKLGSNPSGPARTGPSPLGPKPATAAAPATGGAPAAAGAPGVVPRDAPGKTSGGSGEERANGGSPFLAPPITAAVRDAAASQSAASGGGGGWESSSDGSRSPAREAGSSPEVSAPEWPPAGFDKAASVAPATTAGANPSCLRLLRVCFCKMARADDFSGI